MFFDRLKRAFSLFDRCKILTSNWLNIHCFDVMLIFPKIMRTIQTKIHQNFLPSKYDIKEQYDAT